MARGPDWLAHVNEPQTEAELARVRASVQRGIPLGGEVWVKETAAALGLEFTLRSRVRPRDGARPAPPQAEGLFAKE